MRISRSIAPVLFIALSATGLAACASGAAAEPTASPSASSSARADRSDAATAEPEATEAAAAPSGDYVTPAWALPTTGPGDLLTSVEGPNFTVDIYQAGTAPATSTGSFVDPDTNTPLIEVGDEVVWVNYVITNSSTEPIQLTALLVDVTPRYADWPYMQGMDSIVDRALNEQMQVNNMAIGTTGAEAPYAWAPGESFSYGDNFEYQAGSPITFVASLTPSDDAGDLLHDQRAEVEVSTSIK